ncbi:hypothetical protein LEP1GSC126_3939 [Leptospira kirschneri str. 200801774]|nr:hypothetical protein LEP1GSC126_3110 [Leptospira kirschneri str. 200801774]EMO82192.1 hypothetical protein LEP1GSC126_3939 [Leptospira kirschneri str. 200801774]
MWGWLWLSYGALEVTQQNAFYESVLGSSYWYFMKIESDSKVS